jgi:hypothetical protein
MTRRTHYRERQRLRTVDLRLDQTYHRDARSRHVSSGPHRPGIVSGLQVERDESRDEYRVRVHPGAGVDADGRLLVLPDLAEEDVAEGSGRLLYCWLSGGEETSTAPTRRRVMRGAAEYDRIVESVAVRLTSTPVPPEPSALLLRVLDLTAGSDLAPSGPIDGGAYGTVFAAQVMAGGDQARLRLGARGPTDGEHFAFGVRDAEGAWVDRLTVARNGWTRLYGTLHLVSPVVDMAGPANAEAANTTNAADVDTMSTTDATSARATTPYADIASRACGGLRLELPDRPSAPVRDLCEAEVPATGRAGQMPVALEFATGRPAAPGAALWRLGLESDPEADAPEDLRLALAGMGETGDTRRRLAVGARFGTERAFAPFLSFLADRSVKVHGKKGGAPKVNGEGKGALKVHGQVRQQPLPADASNLLFKQLLVLASVSGFLSVATKDPGLVVEVEGQPGPIPAGVDWSFSVSIENAGDGLLSLLWLVTLEDVASSAVPRPFFVGNISLAKGDKQSIPVHDPVGIAEAGEYTIWITVTAKRNLLPVHAAGKTTVRVLTPPQLDLGALPDVALPGEPWSAEFVVRNEANSPIYLQSAQARVVVGDERSTWVPLLSETENGEVEGGGTRILQEWLWPDAASAEVDALVEVILTYLLGKGDEESWTARAQRVVQVRRHLGASAELPATITTGVAWDYELTLENLTNQRVSELRVVHILRDPAGTVVSVVEVQAIASLPADAVHTRTIHVDGVATEATSLQLAVVLEYRQEGREWSFESELGSVAVEGGSIL